eukprot:CAMPEP_0118665840 /NCGR_PEP_ID=MMETSP0785-20121206/18859_1 /TAXON_ID=91992 /ORGANISM="Bolidomonas pacifica, Strain CCMP 1866" /LENGTH=104 /DNA_ID=CAMNT_0006560037 /DNA_START=840 /DNA_END=1155 /DNA_ORIENTATION=-
MEYGRCDVNGDDVNGDDVNGDDVKDDDVKDDDANDDDVKEDDVKEDDVKDDTLLIRGRTRRIIIELRISMLLIMLLIMPLSRKCNPNPIWWGVSRDNVEGGWVD